MAKKIDADDALSQLAAGPGYDMPAPLYDLIDQFRSSAGQMTLNETSLRETYLNPVFEHLGWDPRNRRGEANKDRDVILEDSVIIDGIAKAPDYAFVIGGHRKFFAEAKRPSVDIETSKAPAYQIRRYCWSAALPFGLLTDFEEWAIYDCRAVPDPNDSTSVGRLAYFRYSDLPAKWSLLAGMFAKASILSGSLDNLAAGTKEPRNARPIDDAFLGEIRGWRASLASFIAHANPGLNVLQLSDAVQTLIDRIIFLRIAEARGLEPPNALKELLDQGPGLYGRLWTLFQRADDRYNSGLFHISAKPEVAGSIDTVSPALSVADGVIAPIISRLYYPEPYVFSVVPADILGRIYEQFLGEIVTLKEDRTISVELKPEVRKAGGVYYTPSPIVDYIVEQTVGPLVSGKTPADIAKLRIVDPACVVAGAS